MVAIQRVFFIILVNGACIVVNGSSSSSSRSSSSSSRSSACSIACSITLFAMQAVAKMSWTASCLFCLPKASPGIIIY
jgi:hypothetical protein